MDSRDRRLGMDRAISRRDLLNGVSVRSVPIKLVRPATHEHPHSDLRAFPVPDFAGAGRKE